MRRFVPLTLLCGCSVFSCSVLPAQDETAAPVRSLAATDPTDADKDAPAIAIKGTPNVDGEVEEAWAAAPDVMVNKIVTSESSITEKEMATATVKLMWDAEHLYALWNVKDPKLSDDGLEAHEVDSIELFVDELNEKSGSYQKDDVQYRVSFTGKLTGGEGFVEDNIKAVAKKTDDGYLVEMAVKLAHAKREPGTKMGLELQVNDNTGSSRGAVAKWHHAENDSYMSTSDFGVVELRDAKPEVSAEKKAAPIEADK